MSAGSCRRTLGGNNASSSVLSVLVSGSPDSDSSRAVRFWPRSTASLSHRWRSTCRWLQPSFSARCITSSYCPAMVARQNERNSITVGSVGALIPPPPLTSTRFPPRHPAARRNPSGTPPGAVAPATAVADPARHPAPLRPPWPRSPGAESPAVAPARSPPPSHPRRPPA